MRDVLDILLDDKNKEPIVLKNEVGKRICFEQIAVIPYDGSGEEKIYCVLKPVDKIEGISDDEAIVFVVEEVDGENVLCVESDAEIAKAVFECYYDLLDESLSKDKSKEINKNRKNLRI